MTTPDTKSETPTSPDSEIAAEQASTHTSVASPEQRPREIGGPKGLEPTRYGDWERKGRCVDF